MGVLRGDEPRSVFRLGARQCGRAFSCNLDLRIREEENETRAARRRFPRRSRSVRGRRAVSADPFADPLAARAFEHTDRSSYTVRITTTRLRGRERARFVLSSARSQRYVAKPAEPAEPARGDVSRLNRRRCCLLSSRAFRAHSSSRRNTSSLRSVAGSSMDDSSGRALAPVEWTRRDVPPPGSSFSLPGEKSTGLETCVFHPTRDGARMLASRVASGPSSRRTVSSKSRRTECTSVRRTAWPLHAAWMRVAASSRGSIVPRETLHRMVRRWNLNAGLTNLPEPDA